MARTTTVQYRPLSTLETSTDDGLSVRASRDLGWAQNNYRYHAGNHKIVSLLCVPVITTMDDVVNNLIVYLGRWYIPPGHRQVRWWITTRLTVGSDGTDECTWTLCSSPDFYAGLEAFDSTQLSDYVSSTITINDTSYQRKNNTMTLGRADFNGYRWFYLLGENDTGDTNPSCRAACVALDVQPLVT